MIRIENIDDFSQDDYCCCGPWREAGPQTHAVLVLELDGRAYIEFRDYHGGDGICEAEWHGRRLVWEIPDGVEKSKLVSFLRAEGTSMLDTINGGHQIEFDGQKKIGTLTDNAAEASHELRGKLLDLPTSQFVATTIREWTRMLEPHEMMLDLDRWIPGWRDGVCDYGRGAELAEAEARQNDTILVDTVRGLMDLAQAAKGFC